PVAHPLSLHDALPIYVVVELDGVARAVVGENAVLAVEDAAADGGGPDAADETGLGGGAAFAPLEKGESSELSGQAEAAHGERGQDRKSTRLNSSHVKR